MNWVIVLIALWTYPIITYYLVKRNRNSKSEIKTTLIILTLVGLITLSSVLDISTTIDPIDWIFLTFYYFALCYLLWKVVTINKLFIKIIGYTLIVIFFGIGYISASIGALGVGFIVAEFEPNKVDKLTQEIIYKETALGNAISDGRGIKVEIFRQYKYIPFIEKRISKNEYYGLAGFSEMDHTFDAQSNSIRLNLKKSDKDSVKWEKIIKISRTE